MLKQWTFEIYFFTGDADRKLEPPSANCFIVTNPPYGERLPSKDIFELYANLGSLLKRKFSGWPAWVISSNEEALKRLVKNLPNAIV